DPTVISNSGSFDAPAAFAVFDPLMYSDNGAVKPSSAESLTSSDATVWMLKLHPNMKFSDGTPWDAAAVKYNWERIMDPANASPSTPRRCETAQTTMRHPSPDNEPGPASKGPPSSPPSHPNGAHTPSASQHARKSTPATAPKRSSRSHAKPTLSTSGAESP